MDFQVNISTRSKDHLIEAIKVFWQSRGFSATNQTDSDISLIRGKKGYKWIAINPFKYYFIIKCQVKQDGDNVEVICTCSTEKDISKNVFRDILIKSEFQLFEKYINSYTKGIPFNLKDISRIKQKSIWPQFILNLILPGFGLFFTGSSNGIMLGVLTVFYGIFSAVVTYVNFILGKELDLFSFPSNMGYIFMWGISSIIGVILIQYRNYESIYEFDNEQ